MMLAGHALVLLAAIQPASASAAPADLNAYGLICFCTSRVATPHRVVAMDNNGRVLAAARTPKTRAQLAVAGAPATDSQLLLLRKWGLLALVGDRYRTNFPVLGPPQMQLLRSRLAPVAGKITAASRADLDAIATELRKRGRLSSARSVLFAYILDGLTWRQLEQRRKLPGQQIDVDHPYWNGTFWAVFPRQDDMPGTNSRREGRGELRMMWNPQTLPRYGPIANAEETGRWLSSLGGASRLRPPASLANAVVVDETAGDPLFQAGNRIAARIADAMGEAPIEIAAATRPQRVLIATHELIWMLLDRMTRVRPSFAEPAVNDALAARFVVAVRPAGTP